MALTSRTTPAHEVRHSSPLAMPDHRQSASSKVTSQAVAAWNQPKREAPWEGKPSAPAACKRSVCNSIHPCSASTTGHTAQAGVVSTRWPSTTCATKPSASTAMVPRAGQVATAQRVRRPSTIDRAALTTTANMPSSSATRPENTGTGHWFASVAGTLRVISSHQARHQNTKP